MHLPVHYCDIDNFGDQLNKYIIGKITGCVVELPSEKDISIYGIGSILEDLLVRSNEKSELRERTILFGSGFGHESGKYIHDKTIKTPESFKTLVDCYALRGKLTLNRVERILGYKLDSVVLGDPGLLVDELVDPSVANKCWTVGIVPHFADKNNNLIKKLAKGIPGSIILDITKDPEDFLRDLSRCETVLSTALHPLIACDSFGIPNQWIRLNEKTTTRYKFNDYYSIYDRQKEPILLTRESVRGINQKTITEDYDIPQGAIFKTKNKLRNALLELKNDYFSRLAVADYVTSNVSGKKVLIVEPNPYHGEILPGFTKYFQDLGYGVDLLIRDELIAEDPFGLQDASSRPRVFHGTPEQIKCSLFIDKTSSYDLIFISTNVWWEKGKNVSSYIGALGFVPRGRYGSLFVEHNLSFLEEDDADFLFDGGRVITLLPYKLSDRNVTSKMVNPHFFGDVKRVMPRPSSAIRVALIGSSNNVTDVKESIFRVVRNTNPKEIKFVLFSEIKDIPDDLRGTVEVYGRLNFKKYLGVVNTCDYLLTLFGNDPANSKYGNGTTTGTIQLSLGLKKPMIIDCKHADMYGFGPEEAVVFGGDFSNLVTQSLVAARSGSYKQKVNALERKARLVNKNSLTNLEQAIENLHANSETIDLVDRSTLRNMVYRKENTEIAEKNKELEATVHSMRDEINHLAELHSQQSKLIDSIVSSKRYMIANKAADTIRYFVPKRTKP